MQLIIGGAYQGKRAYASKQFGIMETEWADGTNCPLEDLFTCKGIHHFHEYVRRCLKENQSLEGLEDKIVEKNPDMVIVTNELGYGVVPVEPFDRAYREATGRLCCKLAKRAKTVHRVVCGIGTVIKND